MARLVIDGIRDTGGGSCLAVRELDALGESVGNDVQVASMANCLTSDN